MSLVDLAYTPEEVAERSQDAPCPISDAPKYPYGLQISLDEKTLEKLNVDYSDWSVGDVFPLDVIVKVTSVSENETSQGKNCCISLQITHLGPEEHEDVIEEASDDLEPHGYRHEDENADRSSLQSYGYRRAKV